MRVRMGDVGPSRVAKACRPTTTTSLCLSISLPLSLPIYKPTIRLSPTLTVSQFKNKFSLCSSSPQPHRVFSLSQPMDAASMSLDSPRTPPRSRSSMMEDDAEVDAQIFSLSQGLGYIVQTVEHLRRSTEARRRRLSVSPTAPPPLASPNQSVLDLIAQQAKDLNKHVLELKASLDVGILEGGVTPLTLAPLPAVRLWTNFLAVQCNMNKLGELLSHLNSDGTVFIADHETAAVYQTLRNVEDSELLKRLSDGGFCTPHAICADFLTSAQFAPIHEFAMSHGLLMDRCQH